LTEDEDDRNYTVGFRKPPKEHRFQKGTSGNPAGRKKKEKPNYSRAARAAFNELTEVMIAGKRCRMSRKEVIVEQRIARALKMDKRAIRELIKLRAHAERNGDAEPVVVRLTGADANL